MKLQFPAFSNFIYQKQENYEKAIPLPSTFSQLLPIYQICAVKRSLLLRKLFFFYYARINFFLDIKSHS